MSTARRRPGALVAGLSCAALLLTACGGGNEPDAESAASSAASSSPSESAAGEPSDAEPAGGLAEGLLPAEAFGAEATVVPVSRQQLEQGAGLAADPASLDIRPEECAAAVEGTQPEIEDYDEVAAESATVGGATTVEVLLQGEATAGALEGLAGAATRCPQARISSPELGEAVVTFEDLEAPDLGDGAAAVRYTTTLTQGGQEVSVPTLIGVAQDGDRVVLLLTIATDGSQPDAAAFTALLEQAFEVQAEALG
jgi:hypothetical protein